MKRKILIISIALILVLVLFSPVKEFIVDLTSPDKILRIGDRVDEDGIDFYKEIENRDKIDEFENLFDEVKFEEEVIQPEKKSDFVTQLLHTKEGTFTHWYEIWLNDEEAIVIKGMDRDQGLGVLKTNQVEKLKEILD